MRNQLDGGSEDYPFQKEWHAAAIRFRDIIGHSYPRLSLADPLTSKVSSPLAYRLSATPTPSARQSEVIALESDEEGGISQRYTPTSTPKRKHPFSKSAQVTPLKRSRLNDIPQYTPTSTSVDRSAPYAKRFTLTEIRHILQDAHIGLPNQIDPKATKRMIKDSLTGWDEPLKDLFRFTEHTVMAMILERAASVFGIWRGTQFFELLEEVCRSFFEQRLNEQIRWAERVLTVERQQALTLHEDTMRAASERAFTTLDKACRNERAKAFLNHKDPGWDDNLGDSAKIDRISKVSDAQLGPNPYLHELRAISVRPRKDTPAMCFADSHVRTLGAITNALSPDSSTSSIRAFRLSCSLHAEMTLVVS